MNDLIKYFGSDLHDRVIHKWSNYFDIYDEHFSKFRGTKVNLLEIGIGNGGSLQMWRWYFGREANVFGVDIEPNKCFEEERIKCYCCDQSDPEQLMEVYKDIGCVDIVIDDGSHHMRDQITAFETIYPLVSSEGIYSIEDIHTSFWEEYEGGIDDNGHCHQETFLSFIKSKIEKLSAIHSRGRLKVDDFSMTTRGIYFYNSIVVIEKGIDCFDARKAIN